MPSQCVLVCVSADDYCRKTHAKSMCACMCDGRRVLQEDPCQVNVCLYVCRQTIIAGRPMPSQCVLVCVTADEYCRKTHAKSMCVCMCVGRRVLQEDPCQVNVCLYVCRQTIIAGRPMPSQCVLVCVTADEYCRKTHAKSMCACMCVGRRLLQEDPCQVNVCLYV